MSSILKVDQIQLANGSTPTASDLGLNVSNQIVQQKWDTKSSGIGTSSTSFVNAGYLVTFTPIFADSKIIVELKGGRPWLPNTNNQVDVAVVIDGNTAINLDNERILSVYDDTSRVHTSLYGQRIYSNTGTATRTYEIYWKVSSSTTQYLNQGNVFDQSLVVTEIAG